MYLFTQSVYAHPSRRYAMKGEGGLLWFFKPHKHKHKAQSIARPINRSANRPIGGSQRTHHTQAQSTITRSINQSQGTHRGTEHKHKAQSIDQSIKSIAARIDRPINQSIAERTHRGRQYRGTSCE